jgi:two-component system response regulator FixJ
MTSDSTVFVVDDDELARRSVCALVASRGCRAVAFSSAEAFLATYDVNQPGCLVTDVRMLGMDGLELQERLRSLNVRIPVIVITAYATTPLTVRAMQSGAITLLEKPCYDEKLWQAIEAALDQDRKQRLVDAQRRDIATRMAQLSDGERKVLDLMLAGKPNKSIARALDVSIRTVEARRHNIFKKLGTDSVAELVRLVLQVEPPEECN